MNRLVTITGNDVFTDSFVLSEGTETEHRAIQQLIRTYLSDIEDFGKVTFEMLPLKSGQKQKYINLTDSTQY